LETLGYQLLGQKLVSRVESQLCLKRVVGMVSQTSQNRATIATARSAPAGPVQHLEQRSSMANPIV
jgi:hypothetical protein